MSAHFKNYMSSTTTSTHKKKFEIGRDLKLSTPIMFALFFHRWNGTTERSGMAVLEINLPSGYKASNGGSIKEVKRKMHTTSLRAAQHSNGLEIFYFDFVSFFFPEFTK